MSEQTSSWTNFRKAYLVALSALLFCSIEIIWLRLASVNWGEYIVFALTLNSIISIVCGIILAKSAMTPHRFGVAIILGIADVFQIFVAKHFTKTVTDCATCMTLQLKPIFSILIVVIGTVF